MLAAFPPVLESGLGQDDHMRGCVKVDLYLEHDSKQLFGFLPDRQDAVLSESPQYIFSSGVYIVDCFPRSGRSYAWSCEGGFVS
jgi:hypothetical protein